MKIERDKVYLTRCGEKVRVVCVDAGKYMPIIGVDSHSTVSFWNERGEFLASGEESPNDLVSEYVEPPKPREVWVRIQGEYLGHAFNDYEKERLIDHGTLVKFREVIEA